MAIKWCKQFILNLKMETSYNCTIWCPSRMCPKINSSVISKGAMNKLREMFPLARMFPLASMHTTPPPPFPHLHACLLKQIHSVSLTKLSWTFQWINIFGFRKLKISFSEIHFQKKPSHTSLIPLFELRNREEVSCKNEKLEMYW